MTDRALKELQNGRKKNNQVITAMVIIRGIGTQDNKNKEGRLSTPDSENTADT